MSINQHNLFFLSQTQYFPVTYQFYVVRDYLCLDLSSWSQEWLEWDSPSSSVCVSSLWSKAAPAVTSTGAWGSAGRWAGQLSLARLAWQWPDPSLARPAQKSGSRTHYAPTNNITTYIPAWSCLLVQVCLPSQGREYKYWLLRPADSRTFNKERKTNLAMDSHSLL